jgi:hypothetical protein
MELKKQTELSEIHESLFFRIISIKVCRKIKKRTRN